MSPGRWIKFTIERTLWLIVTSAISGLAGLFIGALVLPKARRGDWVAAFALSEKEAGSDVALVHQLAAFVLRPGVDGRHVAAATAGSAAGAAPYAANRKPATIQAFTRFMASPPRAFRSPDRRPDAVNSHGLRVEQPRLILVDLDARLEQLAELRATRVANDVVVDRAGQQHDDPHAAAGRLREHPGHPGVEEPHYHIVQWLISPAAVKAEMK